MPKLDEIMAPTKGGLDAADPMPVIGVPEVKDTELVFGAALRLLPPYSEIPDEFKRHYNPFHKAVSGLFFKGGKLSDYGITPKPGADLEKVMRAVAVCIRDWSPKHEHKTAGTAYLLSQWCDYSAPKKDNGEQP